MNRLTKNEIIALAQLPMQDPQLNAFRTRILIAYTAGMNYILGSVFDKEYLKNGWLIITAETENGFIGISLAKPKFVPLHPLIRKIFEKYNNDIPSFNSSNIKKFRKQLAAEMSNKMFPKASEQDWERRLVYTFRSTNNVLQDMQAQGLRQDESLLLTGLNDRLSSYPVIGLNLEDLFIDPFFDYLISLAEQHGIDCTETMEG